MKRHVLVGFVLALLTICPLCGFPADRTWIGGSSSDWSDAANWDPAGVPLPSESIAVSNFTTIVLTGNVTLASLELRGATLVVSNQLVVSNLFVGNSARIN